MLRIALLTLLLAACASDRPSLYRPAARAEPRVDILDYEIDVDIDHRAGHVQGRVAVTFSALADRGTRSLLLDAVGLQFREAYDSQGRPLALDESDWAVEIYLAERLQPGETETVVIEYEAFPRRGIYFVAPEPGVPSSGWQVWTMGQAEEARHWMPVWDRPNDRATHTLTLNVDETFTTMAAGELIDTQRLPRSQRRRDTWRMDIPHVSYLITFVAGDFVSEDIGSPERPLPLLAEAEDLERAREHLAPTDAVLDFLGEYTGAPYPFGKYAQSFVREFTAGGMENISATTLYDEGIHPPAAEPQTDLTGLLVHEAAHQWFGDLITCESWGELWLNEGFAEFSEVLWVEHTEGSDEAALLVQEKLVNYLALSDEESHPIVWHDYTDPAETFDAHAYEGAAVRLNFLRHQLGQVNFDTFVRNYVATFAGEVVNTEDLLAALNDTLSDYDFTPSFREWFYETGHPRLVTEVVQTQEGPNLRVRQTQGDDGWREVFHARVRVAWSRGGQTHAVNIWLDQVTKTLQLTGQGTLDWVYFDADGVLPAEIRREQPATAWAAQLAQADEPLLRLFAAQWFLEQLAAPDPSRETAELLSVERLALLRDTVADEREWIPTRLSALAALDGELDGRLIELRRELADGDEPRLRAIATSQLHYSQDDRDRERLRRLSEDANTEVAMAAFFGLRDSGEPRLLETVAQRVWETNDVRLAYRLTDLASTLAPETALPFLIGVARRHPERWVRAEAVSALGERWGEFDEVVHRTLCEALFDRSNSVRADAARALMARGDERAVEPLRARLQIENDESVYAALHDALASFE